MSTTIGNIGNTYGGLIIKEVNRKYYCIIEDPFTDFDNIDDWEEIPKSLYDELIKYDKDVTEKWLKSQENKNKSSFLKRGE